MSTNEDSTQQNPGPATPSTRPTGPEGDSTENTPREGTLHGEFKVPGGKLVVADLTVRDGVIERALINGDFFLEPDEALDDINAALTGAPADLSHAELTRRIGERIRPHAVLFGFDARAVATAVRRALGLATTWDDHHWEVLGPTPYPIEVNVALDEIITRQVGAGLRPPTMRLWEWDSPAVVIGSFQSLGNEVDPDAADRYGITVVRRISGGGAMFMESGNCVTYSLYTPQTLVDGMSFADSYPFLDRWVMDALAQLGVEAHYVPLNDIATPEGKIGGAAQKRLSNGGMLHHVTMSYDIDADKMSEVLRVGKEKISDKGIASAKKRVDPLKRQTGRSREEILQTLQDVFTERYGAHRATLDPATLAEAEQLAETKFRNPEWTARVP